MFALLGSDVGFSRDLTNAAGPRSATGEPLLTARRFETVPGGAWDTNLFRRHFAFDALLSRALDPWVSVREVPLGFRHGIEDASRKDLVKAWQAADSIRLLRHAQREDGLHCQYRLVQRSGELSYWTLVFAQRDGRPGIVDAHDHSGVPWFRHLVEGAFLMANSDSTLQLKLPDPRGPGITAKSMADLRQFLGLAFDNKSAQALEMYSRLPPSIQSKEFVKLAYAACLRDSDRPDSKQVYAELKASLTGSLIQELSALNQAYQEKSVYALMAAARDIQEKNGTDAYLDIMQARVHRHLGAMADAEAEAIRAVTAEPTLVEAHSLLIDLALKKGDYATVAQRIRHHEQASSVDLRHLAEKVEFADFARSAPGREWLASHGSSANSNATGSRTNSVEASSRRHKLQGIFLSKAKPTALIDGRTVEKGDRLPGGYIVQSITNKSVTLVDGSGAATVLSVK